MEKNLLLKRLKQGFFIGLMFIFIGMGLNIAAFMLPQKPIHDHILDSVSTFQQEGALPQLIKGYKGTILDNNSDAWMLLLADYDGEESAIDKAMSGYYRVYPCENSGMIGVDNISVMDTEESCGVNSYSRYWHGWMFFVRFALMFFTYSDMRAINMFLQFALAIGCFLMLERRGLSKYSFAFLTAMLVLVPTSTALSFEYSFIYYIFTIGMIIILRYHEKLERRLGYSLYFFMLGLCTSYFDFLTFPLLTLGMPLVILGLLRRDENAKEIGGYFLKEIVFYSMLWGVGYAGMWVSKWILGSLLTSRNIIQDAISQVILRTSNTKGLGALSEEKISYLYTVFANFGVICKGPYIILFLVSIMYALRNLRKTKCSLRKRMKVAFPFMVIAMMPFVWYLFVMNHSALHNHFTYRELVICVFAGLCAIQKFSEGEETM